MSDITPQQQSMVWKPTQNPIEGFGVQPILGADYAGDDPIQGLMINSLAGAAGVGFILAIGGGVIPLAMMAGSGFLLVANDYLLQCKRIKDPNWNAVEVKAEPVAEPPPITPPPVQPTPAPEQPIPVEPVAQPTPIVETPAPVVTSSDWEFEAIEERSVAAAVVLPDLAPVLTPEQVKATEFAQQFLSDDRVWSAEQLAAQYSMTVEQWCKAFSWLAATLPEDYLWKSDFKVLVKL